MRLTYGLAVRLISIRIREYIELALCRNSSAVVGGIISLRDK